MDPPKPTPPQICAPIFPTPEFNYTILSCSICGKTTKFTHTIIGGEPKTSDAPKPQSQPLSAEECGHCHHHHEFLPQRSLNCTSKGCRMFTFRPVYSCWSCGIWDWLDGEAFGDRNECGKCGFVPDSSSVVRWRMEVYVCSKKMGCWRMVAAMASGLEWVDEVGVTEKMQRMLDVDFKEEVRYKVEEDPPYRTFWSGT